MFRKRNIQIGARPGTLEIAQDSPLPRIRMIDYSANGKPNERDIEDLSELKSALEGGSVTWIDIQGFGDQSVIQSVGNFFGLHALLLEDVVSVPQRPKAEVYKEQLLLIVRMVQMDGDDELDLEQVSIVLGPHYVITFQERYGDVLDPVRRRIRSETAPVRIHGADYLAYAIADTIVDAYYPVLEAIGDRLEKLEDDVVNNPTPRLLQQLNRLKNRLGNLRRSIWPQREAMSSLARGDRGAITPEVQIYFRDTHDHCVQTSEVIEMYREMVTGLMNTYLSSVANRTNEVMRVLTIVATIFVPLTFVAGVYGMNFEYMPELRNRWAYPLVWSVMFVSAAGMLAFFWKKGWIGSNRDVM